MENQIAEVREDSRERNGKTEQERLRGEERKSEAEIEGGGKTGNARMEEEEEQEEKK